MSRNTDANEHRAHVVILGTVPRTWTKAVEDAGLGAIPRATPVGSEVWPLFEHVDLRALLVRAPDDTRRRPALELFRRLRVGRADVLALFAAPGIDRAQRHRLLKLRVRCVDEDDSPEERTAAIVAAVARVASVSPSTRRAAVRELAREHDLTPTELRVLELVVEGFVRDEIALILAMKDETVRFHLDNIRGRTGAATVEGIWQEIAWAAAFRRAM
jgi:DNA-binding NarL/FixJ family response regulator